MAHERLGTRAQASSMRGTREQYLSKVKEAVAVHGARRARTPEHIILDHAALRKRTYQGVAAGRPRPTPAARTYFGARRPKHPEAREHGTLQPCEQDYHGVVFCALPGRAGFPEQRAAWKKERPICREQTMMQEAVLRGALALRSI